MSSLSKVKKIVTNGSTRVKNFLLLKETAVVGSTKNNLKRGVHSNQDTKMNSALRVVESTEKEEIVVNIKQKILMVIAICHKDQVVQHSEQLLNLLEMKRNGSNGSQLLGRLQLQMHLKANSNTLMNIKEKKKLTIKIGRLKKILVDVLNSQDLDNV